MPFVFDETNSFCISLYSNYVRWEKMHARFEKLDMKVTRFRASTERDLVGNFANFLNIGQKCCAHSHVRVWEHILMKGLEYALVLEDDACFDMQWKEKLDDFYNQGITDFDIIMLNCSEPFEPTFTWRKVNEQFLTGGYIISKRGVEKILSSFTQCYCASDWMTSRLQNFGNAYSYYPWLIIQDGSDSTIGSNAEADHAKVIKCLNDINYSLDNYCI